MKLQITVDFSSLSWLTLKGWGIEHYKVQVCSY